MSAFNSERPVITVMVQYLRFVSTAHYLHCLETCGNFSMLFFFFFFVVECCFYKRCMGEHHELKGQKCTCFVNLN